MQIAKLKENISITNDHTTKEIVITKHDDESTATTEKRIPFNDIYVLDGRCRYASTLSELELLTTLLVETEFGPELKL